jgi:2-dehydropantoate 2-reductase
MKTVETKTSPHREEREKIMRTIIYGAGGIGGIIGGHLARIGHEVILIGRSGHVNAINEYGLKLVTPVGTHILRIPAVTGPEQIQYKPDDVIFLTMKSQNTEDALKSLKKCVRKIPVFCVQNGVRNEETAAQLFEDVYGVMVRIGAVYLNDGEVITRRDPAGWLIMGRYPKGTDTLVETVAKQCREANLFVLVTPDIMRYKWGKAMNNLDNAVGAITNASRADSMEIASLAQKELSYLLDEAGIPYVTDAQISKEWPEFTEYAAGGTQSSTWQSLTRKQGSVETDFFNGEVVRLARKLGKEAPINDGLNRIMQEMAAKRETPGKYTIAELKKILGLT